MLKEDIVEHFDNYGVIISQPVLERCVEICEQYGIIDPGVLVDEWIAYSISKNLAEPTVDTLNKAIAQAEFAKSTVSVKNEPKIYNNDIQLVDDDIMLSYIEPTSPKRKAARPYNAATPNRVKPNFSPISYSPLPPHIREVTKDIGKACYTFGQSDIVKACQWTRSRKSIISISLFKDGTYISVNERYMLDTPLQGSFIKEEQIQTIGKKIFEWRRQQNTPNESDETVEEFENELNNYLQVQHCDQLCLMKVTCLGEIYFDEDRSVFLIDFDGNKLRKVQLDLNNCKSYSFFAGQIALIEGMNHRGDTLVVESAYTSTLLKNSPVPLLAEPISMVICSGPYTTDDDLSYQPLIDLISYCAENEPDVIIFTGAFLSEDHPKRKTMAQSYDKHLEKTLTLIANSLSSNTQILIVASHKDVNSTSIYPTCPYEVDLEVMKKLPNIHLLPDPCIVDMDGLTVGLTSTDILDHLSANEVSLNDGIDQTKRVVSCLFNSKSFYPLRPPANDLPLDVGLTEKYCKLDTLPNLMVFPNKSREFIRDYSGCLCINPGVLAAKETRKIARLVVYPPMTDKSKWYYHVAGQIINV